VPGATDDLIAVKKAKAPKAAAKHVTELPVIPNYEYNLPVDSSKDKQGQTQLSADELKVCGQQQRPWFALVAQTSRHINTGWLKAPVVLPWVD